MAGKTGAPSTNGTNDGVEQVLEVTASRSYHRWRNIQDSMSADERAVSLKIRDTLLATDWDSPESRLSKALAELLDSKT